MKADFNVGDRVKATSRRAFGCVSLPHDRTIEGAITQIRESNSGPLGPPKYKVREWWFYGSELSLVSGGEYWGVL